MYNLNLKHIFQHKYAFLASTALLVIPIYSWKSLFNYWKKLKEEYEQEVLFHKRHNCVVTYQANKGVSGWPPHTGRYNTSGSKVFEYLYEPILYFIRTAKKSLDIAVMLINVKVIYLELLKARKRGVKIRIVHNFYHCDSSKKEIRNLMAEGINYQFYITPNSNLDTIMHNKYIIKDYCEGGGYVCTGSMNFTTSSVLNNYESFVFTTNHYVVEAFEGNFEECWHIIKVDNEGIINRTILMDAQFDK